MSEQFVVIKKDFLLDPSLTATAVRVGAYLADRATMRGGWTIHYREVMKTLGLGKNAVYAAFNSLENAAYMSKGPVVNGNQATPPVVHHDKILHRSPKQGMADTDQRAQEPFPESRNGSAGTANPERESGKTNHDRGVNTEDPTPSNQERLTTSADDLGRESRKTVRRGSRSRPEANQANEGVPSAGDDLPAGEDVPESATAVAYDDRRWARHDAEVAEWDRLADQLCGLRQVPVNVQKLRAEMREEGHGGRRSEIRYMQRQIARYDQEAAS